MIKIGSLSKDADLGAKRVRQDEPKAGRVQVLVRMRPALKQEKGTPEADLSMCEESSTINMTHMGREYSFAADHIFGPESTQGEVYESGGVREVVASVMEGRNACVFAYGNTGTGKTYTMGGEGVDKDGVIPFAVRQVLERAKTLNKGGMATCVVSMSVLEIYNDKLRDMLLPPTAPPPAKELAIREDHEGTICVPGLSEKVIETYDAFESLYTRAAASRKTSSTQLNTQSSRSHAVLMIKVVQTFEKGVSTTGSGRMVMTGGNRTLGNHNGKATNSAKTVVGKLNLIDLAGSERNNKTGNRGERLQESQNINLSLFVLSKVIDGLNQGDSRIPYRDSKLTRLLQDSLNPNTASTALMICCIAPSAAMASETCQSLTYASRARSITNVPKALHPGDEPPPTPSRKLMPPPNPTSSTTKPSAEPLKARMDSSKFRPTSSIRPPSTSFGPASRVSSTATVVSEPPQPLKRKWEDKDAAAADQPTSAMGPSRITNKENSEPSVPRKTVAAGQGAAPSVKLPVPPAPASSSTASGKSSTGSSTSSSSQANQGNESMVAAKDMIVQAKALEKEERLAEALRLYEAAELLLPGHEKLKTRVAGLRDRIREQRDRDAAIAEPLPDAMVFEEGKWDFADSPEDNAELLHSAVKERRERMTTFGREKGEASPIDFEAEMFEEQEQREWVARGSMTPPGATIDPAAKEECLKSLHKEIKNVLEAEIVEILNTGTMKQLLKLSGIGKKRAELIMQMRDSAEEGGVVAFRSINDLGNIGLTTVMIAKILKTNAMQRLENE